MLDYRTERLRMLPVRRTDEVWEVAASPMESMVARKPGGPMEQVVACVCVSSEGGATMADVQTVHHFEERAGVDAMLRFATEPHLAGAKPLNYLPSKVRVGPMPEEAEAALCEVLDSLGVKAERIKKPELSDEFFQGLAAHLTEEATEREPIVPIRAPGLMKAKGMTVERVRAFAEGAAEFWAAEPWRLFDEELLWEIEPGPAAAYMRYAIVMGGGGEEYGVALFASVAQVEQISGMHERADLTAIMSTPMWSVGYEELGCLPKADAELWKKEGLVSGDPDELYAIPIGVMMSGKALRPAPTDLTEMEGVLRAFSQLRRRDVRSGCFTVEVKTFDGLKTLTLSAVD